MLFKDIPGLSDIKQTLISSVQRSHVAHAQLFHGQNGSATLPIALAYATYINCENKQADDACGVCPSCSKMSKLAHPDFFHLFPAAGAKITSEILMPKWRKFISETPHGTLTDWLFLIEGKQGNISVEEARNLVQKLSMKPYEAAFKIILIWQPEAMSIATANALLKVLEEPPSQTIFLMVTNKLAVLLPTIISRTQQVYVRQYTDNELVEYLKKDGTTQEEAARITYLANNDFNALAAIKTEEFEHQTDWFANWMRHCYKQDYIKLTSLADEFDALSKEKQKTILELSLTIFRDLFLTKVQSSGLVKQQGTDLQFIQNFAKSMNFTNFETIISLFSETLYHIERNARAKIVFLNLSLKMSSLIRP